MIGAIEQRAATTRVARTGPRMFLDTEGITAAVFRQSTSRADDPQLHSHVVISSKVQTPDGRWRALDARQLMDQQSTFGRVYQATLRAEVTNRYGLAWTTVEKGQAEIAGVPIELIELFSKRAEEIDAELARRLGAFQRGMATTPRPTPVRPSGAKSPPTPAPPSPVSAPTTSAPSGPPKQHPSASTTATSSARSSRTPSARTARHRPSERRASRRCNRRAPLDVATPRRHPPPHR